MLKGFWTCLWMPVFQPVVVTNHCILDRTGFLDPALVFVSWKNWWLPFFNKVSVLKIYYEFFVIKKFFCKEFYVTFQNLINGDIHIFCLGDIMKRINFLGKQPFKSIGIYKGFWDSSLIISVSSDFEVLSLNLNKVISELSLLFKIVVYSKMKACSWITIVS